jgi:omega-6 fatty acid desaturase (delta-12 desaturase)
VHAYVLICLQALWRIYVRFVVDIDIKILGEGFFLHFYLLMLYFSWKYYHMRHHNNMSSVDRDEVFVPKKKKEIVVVVAEGWGIIEYLQHPLGQILMIVLMLLLGWPFYLICNVSRRKYSWRIYVGFVVDIDIKILGGGFSYTLIVGAIFLLEVFSHASSQ